MSGALALLAASQSGGGVLEEWTITSSSGGGGGEPVWLYYGFDTSLGGSVSPTTSTLFGGSAIRTCYFYEEGDIMPLGYYYRVILLEIAGAHSNSGWEVMKINSTSYGRTDATYASSTNTSWIWEVPIPKPSVSGSPGPFTATTTVKFY